MITHFLINLISAIIYFNCCYAGNYTNNLNIILNPINDNLKPTNFQLISPILRIKREPPSFTVIKHRSRYIKQRQKPRRRIKSQKNPKTKYGPPNYSFGEPLTFYEPHIYDVYEATKADSQKHFANDFQEFEKNFGSNIKLETFSGSSSVDNNKPIKFNFYNNYEGGNKESTFNTEPEVPAYWENLTENPKSSYDTEQTYQFQTEYPQKKSKSKRPKQNFDDRPSAEIHHSPEFTLTSQDDNYEIPFEYQKPANIEYEPITKYNFRTESSNRNHHGSQNIYLPPEKPNKKYLPAEVLIQKYAQPAQNFASAETPIQPYRSESPIETYRVPERQTEQYETTLNDNQYDAYSKNPLDFPSTPQNDNRPHEKIYGQFAEPPESEVEVTHASTIKVNPVVYSNDFKPQYSGPKYLPPIINDPDPKTKQIQENTPGPYAEPPPINQAPNYYSTYNPPNHSNLPLNDGKRPSYDFPKTSYEVPIYSSPPIIPNENIHHEYYPPIGGSFINNRDTTITKGSNNVEISVPSSDKFKNQHAINFHTLSASLEELDEPPSSYLDNILGITSTTTARTRKRKRIKAITSKQHNLDTDDLRKAFGSISQLDNTNLRAKRRPPNIPNFILTDASTNQSPTSGEISSENWQPIKVRNNLDLIKLNSTKPVRTQKTSQKKFQDIEVLSIEKSLSHSFYDGTMSPIEMAQKYPGLNLHSDGKIKEIIMNPHNFNRGHNYQNYDGELPKNHKLI